MSPTGSPSYPTPLRFLGAGCDHLKETDKPIEADGTYRSFSEGLSSPGADAEDEG